MNFRLAHLDETLSLGVDLGLRLQTCGLGSWQGSVIGFCPTTRPLPGPSTPSAEGTAASQPLLCRGQEKVREGTWPAVPGNSLRPLELPVSLIVEVVGTSCHTVSIISMMQKLSSSPF